MPPMATSTSKRKWSDVFTDGEEEELYDKQSLMDLCSSKLRYVNPARPPRRRTEVPLLRNVLIVNTMKNLSLDLKQVKTTIDYSSSEDLTVDPGHFEGLPPLSELLTDIMLDPQPAESHQQSGLLSSFNWPVSNYSSLSPLEPTIPTYMDTDPALEAEDKVVHDLLPCTSVGVCGLDTSQSSTLSSSWRSSSEVPESLDCYLSSTSLQPSASLCSMASELAFHASSGPLPSFTSQFENASYTTATSSYTDLTPVTSSSHSHAFVASSNSLSFTSLTSSSLPLNEELVGNTSLTEAELEVLAMAFSSKLPHLSFEELMHALPPSTSRLQQAHGQQSAPSSYFVPSSIQSNGGHTMSEHNPAAPNNPCGARFCRKDQPQPSVDENMVRVLVNL